MRKNYNVADDEWEWYIGQLYSRLIKNLCDKDIKCVVELAPGFRHKIADALKEINFTGTIYVIDNSNDVLDYIKEKYKEILPNANIICINKKFEDSLDSLPSEIDLFLSNHSVDDLIISNYSNGQYNKESNNEVLYNDLLNLWKQLYNDEKAYTDIISKVLNDFKNLFSIKSIKMIIMSQYKSNSYFLGESNYIDKIVDECFNKIKKLTTTDDKLVNNLLDFYPFGENDERYNGKYLTDNTQNAKNWIAGEIKSN